MHLIEINLRQFRIVSMLESQCISSNVFYDSFKFCPGCISKASFRKLSKTIPIWVWAEIQLHFIENNLRQYQVVSESKFNCISSILFYSNSIMRLSRNSMASDWNCCKKIPNCVLSINQLQLFEVILWQCRTVS